MAFDSHDRGTSDACRIMLAGDNGQGEGNGDEGRESLSVTTEKRKRKYVEWIVQLPVHSTYHLPTLHLYRRKNESADGDDLAARVQQLENIIRMTQIQNGQGSHQNGFPAASNLLNSSSLPSINQQSEREYVTNEEAADSPSEAAFSVKSETSAVEEAAVAALGQLSKAKPNEGGDEARICKTLSLAIFAQEQADMVG